MTKAILAAEADKIQDFIFRASRLREVSGGSAILSRFCKDAPKLLACEDVVINDGGAFRLIFANEQAAVQAGATLADLYYMATGCSLSVGEPVPWSGSEADFAAANEVAGQQLHAAKRVQGAAISAHLPQMAFCTSTGLELAYRYTNANPNVPANYVSRYSLYKGLEHRKNEHKEEFVEQFLAAVVGQENVHHFDAPEDAETVGRLDGRGYVAYLVADGNGMGALFRRCKTRADLGRLSQRLSEIVSQSLAEPARRLYEWLVQDGTIVMSESDEQRTIPILPMILGGDDLFVLLPAPWAIAIAAEFCRGFEERMNHFVQQELGWTLPVQERPTMSAALVLCKAKYPFYLAHQHGDKLLKAAKRLAKSSDHRQSTLSIDLIVGNHLVEPDAQTGHYRASLNPYYVDEAAGDAPLTQSIAITRLLAARVALTGLEQKRLAQLRTLFDTKALNLLTIDQPATIEQWQEQLHALVDRISLIKGDDLAQDPERYVALQRLGFNFKIKREKGKNHQMVERPLMPSVAQILYHLLFLLGDRGSASYFRSVRRGRDYYASAFPDLLDWWDYLKELPLGSGATPTESEVTQ